MRESVESRRKNADRDAREDSKNTGRDGSTHLLTEAKCDCEWVKENIF